MRSARTSVMNVYLRASVRGCVCVGVGDCDVNVFCIFRRWHVGTPRYDARAWGINNFYHQSLTIGLLFERKSIFYIRALCDVKFYMRMHSHSEGIGIWLIDALRSHASPESSLFAYAIRHEFAWAAHSQVPTTNHYTRERIYCNLTNEVNSAPILDPSTRNHCTYYPKTHLPGYTGR